MRAAAARALRWRAWLLASIVVITNSLGNFLLSAGMKNIAVELGSTALVRAVFTVPVMAGIVLLVVWLLARLALLSWADLSFVLPVTSLGYLLAVFAGKFLLAEDVSPWRWAGAACILLGTVLAGSTHPRTPEGLRPYRRRS